MNWALNPSETAAFSGLSPNECGTGVSLVRK
jgi:hypothetical protein